jgi:hypothetical protein
MGKAANKVVLRGMKTRFKKGQKVNRGRKPLAIELKAREFILACINGQKGVDALVMKIYSQALKGSFKQQELLLNYILGKPVERLKIDGAYGAAPVMSAPVVKIIADTLRLARLEKDAEEPVPVDENRIAEAEKVLEEAIKLNGHEA